jgi:acyl-CoA synthetase (AMP-forming)/AMP-acid ligase II
VPAHLQPARLVLVPALALTSSGKVDRRATHARYATPTPDPVPGPLAEEATA